MIPYLKHRLHRIAFRGRYTLLDELLRNQTMSQEQLLDKQRRELHRIIRFAANHSDYYAEKYADIVRPGKPLPPVEALPVLHKDEVVQNRDRMEVGKSPTWRLNAGTEINIYSPTWFIWNLCERMEKTSSW